jgi:hypothetical protein
VGTSRAGWVVGPGLEQVEGAVDKDVPVPRVIGHDDPVWQLVILPAEPVYCRPMPQDALPCLKNPVSSITSTASGSASVSNAEFEAQLRQIQLGNKSVDDADRVLVRHVVVDAFCKQRHLSSVLALHDALHPGLCIDAGSLPWTSVFTRAAPISAV